MKIQALSWANGVEAKVEIHSPNQYPIATSCLPELTYRYTLLPSFTWNLWMDIMIAFIFRPKDGESLGRGKVTGAKYVTYILTRGL